MDLLGERPSNCAPVITISSGHYLAQIATYGGELNPLLLIHTRWWKPTLMASFRR